MDTISLTETKAAIAPASAGDDPKLNADSIPDFLPALVDELLGHKMSQLTLPAPVMQIYRQRTRVQHRRMMASWANRVAGINLLVMLFDPRILPAPSLALGICLHLVITLGFLLSAQMLIQQRFFGKAHFIIVPPCLLTVLLTGVLGMISHSPEAFTMYATMGMTIVFIGITFLQIDLSHAAWMGAASLLILLAFVVPWPLPNQFEKLQMMVFFTGTVLALLEGRRNQYKYQFKAFLLQLREELRTEEAGKRNEKLSSMAYTDRLTEVPNRRYFDEMAETINAQHDASLPLAICLFDIDHFKNLNDRLGHLQGDRCLRLVAACLRSELRSKNDILARFGGEEFVILLPNTDAAEAHVVAERIRQAVQDMAHPNPGTDMGIVTISAGVGATLRPGVRVETLLNEADDALYRAKEGGRNRICA